MRKGCPLRVAAGCRRQEPDRVRSGIEQQSRNYIIKITTPTRHMPFIPYFFRKPQEAMSSAADRPVPSLLPIHPARSPPQRHASHDDHHPVPRPKLRLHFENLTHAGTTAFTSTTDIPSLLSSAVHDVLRLLYTDRPRHPIPQIRSITLILRSMPGVAYTTGLALDEAHKEIHFSLEYIKDIASARREKEIRGVVTHEVVHCLQWNGRGSAP